MLTLEQELKETFDLHRFAILKRMMIDYYFTINTAKSNESDFVRIYDKSEKEAHKAVKNLRKRDYRKFCNLYEYAYSQLVDELE